ncbi:MAG: hypothetical protein Ct9H300mP25_11240 [Acidobacteriota bacterium]|nr:MAG: hypothetical protein Ct9H300mP25_11240 [Acidobacteriota bacterium]
MTMGPRSRRLKGGNPKLEDALFPWVDEKGKNLWI